MVHARVTVAAALLAVAGVVLPPTPAMAREVSPWEPNTATTWAIGPGGDNFLTGYNQTETAPPFIGCATTSCRKTGDADGPWLEWVTKISDLPTGSFPGASLVADDGLLFVGGGATNSFLALDMKTGLPAWRFAPDPRTDGATAQYPATNAPTIHMGVVYTTFSNGYMYALEAKTGRKIWSFRATDGYTDKTASRPADADHPRRAALDSYTESSQPSKRHPFGSVHPGVTYPKIHGRGAVCGRENVAVFMTLAGWAYGIDATSGRPLWKRYVDAPEFPGEMVWPEYKIGGALKAENSSLGSSTRRFEAVPGLGCANGEVQILGSDGHTRYLEPRTGKFGPYRCGYTRPCESHGGGDVGPEYERLDVDSSGAEQDMCAASGFNCDMAIGIGVPPLQNSATGPGTKGGDYIVTTLDSRIIRLSWDEHLPLWRREYSAPLPFEIAGTMPLQLDHLEHGFIAQAVVGGPMALDPDIAGKGARPILFAGSQDGHLYVLSVSETGGGLRATDPQAPILLARVGISVNEEVETPYTRRGKGGPWDFNQHALGGLVLGGGVLYVPTWDNKMFAYDVRNPAAPKKIWEHEITWDTTFKNPPFGRTYAKPLADVDMKIWSSPALLGGHLYFSANDGSIYAFNLKRPVKTTRNLVVLGSGLVPFLPEYKQALGTFDRVWTTDDWYKNQVAPPGFRLPGGAAGAGATALLATNLILFWWVRRRGDVSIEIRRGES